MTQISRTYSFNSASALEPGQVESEISNIINSWNNFENGVNVITAPVFKNLTINNTGSSAGKISFYSYDDALTSLVGYIISNFVVQGDATNGLNLNGNGGNICLGDTAGSYGSGSKVVFLPDRSSAPTSNPSSGGVFYSESGALKWRGSNGAIVVVAPDGVKSITNADSPYTVLGQDKYIIANATGGAITVNIPLVASHPARILHIKKTDASVNAVTITRASTDDIEGSATVGLALQYSSRTIYSGGGGRWFILAST